MKPMELMLRLAKMASPRFGVAKIAPNSGPELCVCKKTTGDSAPVSPIWVKRRGRSLWGRAPRWEAPSNPRGAHSARCPDLETIGGSLARGWWALGSNGDSVHCSSGAGASESFIPPTCGRRPGQSATYLQVRVTCESASGLARHGIINEGRYFPEGWQRNQIVHTKACVRSSTRSWQTPLT